MSEFGRKNNEKDVRFDIFVLKLEVMIGLFLFKKIEIEKDSREVDYYMEKELKNWCVSQGFKYSCRDVERPFYITGHTVYKLETKRHCKNMSFSR